MSYYTKRMITELLMFVISILLIVAVVFAAQYAMERKCIEKTAEIGISSRWSFWGGCQIQVKDNIWIPLDNFRYLDER